MLKMYEEHRKPKGNIENQKENNTLNLKYVNIHD